MALVPDMMGEVARCCWLVVFFCTFAFSQAGDAELERLADQGEQALAAHKYAEAEQAYEKLKGLAPNTAEVYGRLGLIYFQESKFQQAVPVLQQALKLKPGLPNTDLLLAMCLSELGHYKDALPALGKGFRRTSDLPLKRMSGLQLLRVYTGLERDDKAVELALEMNRVFPDDAEVLYHTSRIYANFAYVTLRKLAQAAPDSVWRQQAAAEADESQGNLDLAVAEYRRVLEIDPNRRGIHYRLGRVLLRSPAPNARDQALKEFEEELRVDPTNANAAYEAGELYRKSGQQERALQLFQQALRYYPDFEEAQLATGTVLISLNQPGSAVSHIEKAITLNAKNDVSYYRLSQAYRALNRPDEQRKALTRYQELRSQQRQPDSLVSGSLETRDVTRQQVDDKNE